jgi:DNA polymerase III alpha subunit
MNKTDFFHKLVAAGMKVRYGDQLSKGALLRFLWEKKHIMDAGFEEYYLMGFWVFNHHAKSEGIRYWARGAVSSSIVCYSLGITEVDPVKYGLHSVRFVNNEVPKFQFDIESSRFDEFKKGAEKMLEANAQDFDIISVKACLLQDLSSSDYLGREQEGIVPENIDKEIANYALTFPDTMDLYDEYVHRKNGKTWTPTGISRLDDILAPTYGLLVYQEQMFDILREFFCIYGFKANDIRLSIHRGETKKLETYKKETFEELKNISLEEAEKVWEVLTSNRKAFLKAHAVSRVLANYKYFFYNKQ